MGYGIMEKIGTGTINTQLPG